MSLDAVLRITNLRTHFHLDEGVVKAVDGVDVTLERGRTLGVVGESGCGKSVTALTVLRLVPTPPARIVSGSIEYRGNGQVLDLAAIPPGGRAMRAVRGKEIAMIFQEPMTSLSPVHTVGFQIMEVVQLHQGLGKKAAKALAVEMLARVGIPRPGLVVDNYPHQLSGGMRQRAMIARALACKPAILIADEPTTALDVTVQAQILALLQKLQGELGMSLMLITHNLGVVAQIADAVSVFYLGRVVEEGDVHTVFGSPLHPYTQALFASIPRIDSDTRLAPIQGSVPDPFAVVNGCPFRDRCPHRFAACESDAVPALAEVQPGHRVRCYLHSAAEEPRDA